MEKCLGDAREEGGRDFGELKIEGRRRVNGDKGSIIERREDKDIRGRGYSDDIGWIDRGNIVGRVAYYDIYYILHQFPSACPFLLINRKNIQLFAVSHYSPFDISIYI